MKKIVLLATLLVASISYGQFTSPITVLKSKNHDAPPVCTVIGGNTVDLSTITYDLLETETTKYFTIMAKTNDNITDGVVTTIDDIIKYSSGSTDLVVVSAQSSNTAFPTASGCGATFSGAKEFRMVVQYTPAYVTGTSISTVFELVGGDLITFNLNVTAPLLIENLEKFNFTYSSNPAKDYMNISAVKSINKVEVYNLLGQKSISTNVNAVSKTINISELPSGIYIMKVTIDESIGSYKIIKK